MNYDIIVVGAGCAGAQAALEASKHAKVLVIDRKQEIGTPVRCGECIAEFVLDKFKLSRAVLNRVNKLNFFVDNKKFNFQLPVNFCLVDKSKLQKLLVERALSLGAELRLGKVVTGLSKNGVKIGAEELSSKLIIGADGVESRLARFAGMNTRLNLKDIASCVQHTILTTETLDCLEIYIENYAGYGWVFPKGNGLANVGVGVLGNEPLVTKVADEFLAKRFKNFKSLRAIAGCVPLALPNRLYKDNIMLVGDAGRLVNPLGGGGIQNALLSGRLAGAIAGKCISNSLPVSYLKNYEAICRKAIYPRLKTGYKLRKMVIKNPARLKIIFAGAKLLPKNWLKIFISSIYYKDIDERSLFLFS